MSRSPRRTILSRLHRPAFATFLFSGISLVQGQIAPYQFTLATGPPNRSSQSFNIFSQLPQQSDSLSENVASGAVFGRRGVYRIQKAPGSSLESGLSLYAEAETTLNLTDAVSIPGYTEDLRRPYSKTEMKVNKERLEVIPAPGASSATVRLTASLSVAVTGIFPPERFWQNQGRTFLRVIATRKRKSNGLVQGTVISGNFDITHILNRGSTLPSSIATSVFGGSANGGWNVLSQSGTGFIEVSLPSNEFLEVDVLVFTEVEIINFAFSNGNALSTFKTKATGLVKASTPDGTIISSTLGLTKLNQFFLGRTYPIQGIASPPLTLSETTTGGLPVNYEYLSGPASLSGNILTLDGRRGTVFFRATQTGNDTYVPTEASRVVFVEGNPQSLAFTSGSSFPANSVPFDPGATASSGLPVTYQITSGPATTNGRLITPTGNTGTVRFNITQPGDDTFEPALRTEGFVIITAPVTPDTPQTINFPSLITAQAGEAQLVLVTANSGLPVTLELIEGNGIFTGINSNIFTPLAPGAIRIRATQPGGFFNGVSYQAATLIERTFTAQSSGSSFSDAMILLNLPQNLRGPKDDADGDGLPNLVEFALGTDSSDSGSNAVPLVSTTGSPPTALRLTYTRARQDVSYSVQGSADLDSWESVGIDQGTPDALNSVTASAPFSTGYRFLRLSVTLAP